MNMYVFLVGVVLGQVASGQTYQEWLKEQNSEIKSYTKSENDALKKFADQEWKEYKSFLETPSPQKPGPKKIPEAPKWVWKPVLSSIGKSSQTVSSSQKLSVGTLSPKMKVSSSKLLSSSLVAKSSIILNSSLGVSSSTKAVVNAKSSVAFISKIKTDSFNFDYFGVELGFNLNREVVAPTQSSEKAIKKWIGQTSKWSNKTRESFSRLCREYNISGWAQLQLANTVAKKIHGADVSSVSALSWWLLSHDKVDVRLAYLEGKIVLLYHTKATVFGVSYLRLDLKPYYLFDRLGKKGGRISLKGIRTWPQSLSGRVEVDLMKTSLALSKIETYKELVYRVGNRLDTLSLPRNSVQEKLWATYPLVEISVPFNHNLAKGQHTPLIKVLKEKVKGMSEKDAVRFLLNLVQRSFKYETDDEQFGYENYFFPEEILSFKASDCEDRAVFFSYLIKYVVEIPVVLVDYPNHIGAAVSLSSGHQGTRFRHKGKVFYITDPTYLGADIGMEMKGLDTSKRVVID